MLPFSQLHVYRQNGLGYASFMARLGASISPLIMLLEDMWTLLPEVIFCTLAIFSGLIAWLLPETNNARLQETIEDIEQMRYRKNETKYKKRSLMHFAIVFFFSFFVFFLQTSTFIPDTKPQLLFGLSFFYSFLNSQ